jgi:hypothetical protein
MGADLFSGWVGKKHTICLKSLKSYYFRPAKGSKEGGGGGQELPSPFPPDAHGRVVKDFVTILLDHH